MKIINNYLPLFVETDENNNKILNFTDIGITRKGLMDSLLYFSTISDLNKLIISHNQITAINTKQMMERLSVLTQLQYLDISNNCFTKIVSFKYIFDYLTLLPSLRSIQIHHNAIGDDNIILMSKYLSILTLKDNLESLNLTCTKIGSKGLSSICKELSQITNLVKLDLHYNSIDDEGIKELSENITSIPFLEELNLSTNQLTNVSIPYISKILKNSTCMKMCKLNGLKCLRIEKDNLKNQYKNIDISI